MSSEEGVTRKKGLGQGEGRGRLGTGQGPGRGRAAGGALTNASVLCVSVGTT